MRIRQTPRGYIVEVLTEGHPVHDPQFKQYMADNWRLFFVSGFGLGTAVKMTAKLMAGSRQDGTASEQLIIMPTISDPALKHLHFKRRTHGERIVQPV
jgi:hypothetical protein